MAELFAFAMARQLAKLQYWATRALDFDPSTSVQRAQMAVHEFAEDVRLGQDVEVAWWNRISSELEHLNAEISPSKEKN